MTYEDCYKITFTQYNKKNFGFSRINPRAVFLRHATKPTRSKFASKDKIILGH